MLSSTQSHERLLIVQLTVTVEVLQRRVRGAEKVIKVYLTSELL